MRVNGKRMRTIVGYVKRPGCVHRHPVGHGRAPARIGPGVEISLEIKPGNAAIGIAACLEPYLAGVTLGGRPHGFLARIDNAAWPLELPCSNRNIRLHGNVQLRAEPAAAGGRHDADLFDRQVHDRCHRVAVHVRRLGGGMDCNRVIIANRPACFRLDIGMLDEGRGKAALDDVRGRV